MKGVWLTANEQEQFERWVCALIYEFRKILVEELKDPPKAIIGLTFSINKGQMSCKLWVSETRHWYLLDDETLTKGMPDNLPKLLVFRLVQMLIWSGFTLWGGRGGDKFLVRGIKAPPCPACRANTVHFADMVSETTYWSCEDCNHNFEKHKDEF